MLRALFRAKKPKISNKQKTIKISHKQKNPNFHTSKKTKDQQPFNFICIIQSPKTN
jgi:hypothetical protein